MQISDHAISVSGASKASPYESEDFETFLRMLTTQIQNQDPLSPLDSDDFSNQLATFSLVEQQTLTNQNLEKLIGQQEAAGFLEYASIVGRTIVHSGAFEFTGEPVDIEIDATLTEDAATVAIMDEQGRLIIELPIGNGQATVSWDGTTSEEEFALPASYTAEVMSPA